MLPETTLPRSLRVPSEVKPSSVVTAPATEAAEAPVPETGEPRVSEPLDAPIPENEPAQESVEEPFREQPAEAVKAPEASFPVFSDIPAAPSVKRGASPRRADLSLAGNAFVATSRTAAHSPVMRRVATLRAPAKTGVASAGETSKYGLPVTLGLNARYYVTNRLSLGTGIDYTFLARTFPGTYNEVTPDDSGDPVLVRSVTSDAIVNDQHYLGVPLNIYFDFLQSRRFRAYVHAGGEVEKNVRSNYRIPTGGEVIRYQEKVKGVQWSVGGGVGVEVRLGQHVGLFVDPGVRYYFDGKQPSSIRTRQPLMMNFDAGLRFNIK